MLSWKDRLMDRLMKERDAIMVLSSKDGAWMDGRMNGWMDGLTDEGLDVQMDR